MIDSEKFLPSSDEKEELNLSKTEKQSLLINYDNGASVSISSIIKSQSYYVLKETGCLQVWNAKQGQITNRLYLNEPVNLTIELFLLTFNKKLLNSVPQWLFIQNIL